EAEQSHPAQPHEDTLQPVERAPLEMALALQDQAVGAHGPPLSEHAPRSPRARCAPSPLAGEGWGGGYGKQRSVHAGPPSLSLPRKGGGNRPVHTATVELDVARYMIEASTVTGSRRPAA